MTTRAPITLADVDPELRPYAGRIPDLGRVPPGALRIVNALTGLIPRMGVAPGVRLVRKRAGGVSFRLYIPATRRADAALLWLHGGGLVGGRAVMDDGVCSRVAAGLGIVVVSVDYRLAPQHPFPAASDDAFAIWRWLGRRADSLGVDPARIAVGGQSAGGGLAAALVQRVVDAGGPAPIAQWLWCPMLDDRTAADRELDSAGHLVWTNTLNRFGWGSYLGSQPGAPVVPPYAVPARREDLAGLPPAWIGIGDVELFHDEAVAYARRLQEAGVAVTLDVVPGAPHGFETWAGATGVARAYVERADTWLADRLG